MHYGKEINPLINRLNPGEVTGVTPLKRPEEKSPYTYLYTALLNGMPVVVKQFTSPPDDPEHNGVAEANALCLLQGVPGVPKFYGVIMNTTPLGLYWGRSSRGDTIETRAIVEELAGGDLLRDSKIYNDPILIAGYHRDTYTIAENAYRDAEKRKTPFQRLVQRLFQKTSQKTEIAGKNIRAEVGSQIASHFRDCLERGLVDPDFSPHEVFLQVNPDGSLKLLKVDYGMMEHPDEIGASRYDSIEQALIAMIPEVGHSKTAFIFDERDDSGRRSINNLKTMSTNFRRDGSTTLADLLDSYVNKEFYQDGVGTFQRFLDNWEKAMEEHGRYLIKQEDIRQRKTKEFEEMDLFSALLWADETNNTEIILSLEGRVKASHDSLINGVWKALKDKNSKYSSDRESAGKVLSFYREYADPKKLEEAIWGLSGGIDAMEKVTYESLLQILGAENAAWRLPKSYPDGEHAVFDLTSRIANLAMYFGTELGDVPLEAAYFDMNHKIRVKQNKEDPCNPDAVASRLRRFEKENGFDSKMSGDYVKALDFVGKLYNDIMNMHGRVETEPDEFKTGEATRPFRELLERAKELKEPLLEAMALDLFPKSSERNKGYNASPEYTSFALRRLQEFEEREGLDNEMSQNYSVSMYGNQAGEEWERAKSSN